MATERKKRNIRLFKLKKNKNKKVKEPKSVPTKADSAVSSNEQRDNGSKLRVVNGTRKKRRIVRIVVYGVILTVIIALIIVNALTPTGIVESLQNSYNAMGKGSFPISVYSANPKSFYSWNGIHSMINESFFELYNEQGKLVQAASHGMSNPQLEVSEARYLIYDRDRYTAIVYNYSDEIYSLEFDNTVFAADIGRDGTFAVVTDSDTYQSTVRVYNKDNESVYTWNSANFYVTDVAVSDDGEHVAVCMINSKGGMFESYVYILGFDSAEPVYSFTFTDVVSSLTSCGENYILANGFDRAYTLPWNGNTATDLGILGVIRCYDFEVGDRACVISGREDNGQVNTVTVIGETGRITSTFEFNANVTDVCISEAGIAVLSDSDVYLYDMNGELQNKFTSATKSNFVGLTDDGKVTVLDNSKLSRLN